VVCCGVLALRPRVLGLRRRPALTLLAVLAGGLAASPARGRELTMQELARGLETDLSGRVTAKGLELDVDGKGSVFLPVRGAEVVELEVLSDGLFALLWASDTMANLSMAPIRSLTIPPGRSTVRLHLLEAGGWSPTSRPYLHVSGTGRLVVTRADVTPAPEDPGAAWTRYARAALLAPQSLDNKTINTLSAPYWSLAPVRYLSEVLAVGALVVLAATMLAIRFRRGAWRPGVALAAAVVAAVAGSDVHLLTRLAPVARLRPEPDPEARIRDGYPVSPVTGALAVLARRVIPPGARVGIQGAPDDWFGPQTLCFDLFPRPCVFLKPGEAVHSGISGVTRLPTEALDTIVVLDSPEPLPPGFTPTAAVSRHAYVARLP